MVVLTCPSGQTITVTGPIVRSGNYWDGQPVVSVANLQDQVQATTWTPPFGNNRNGAVKNRRGNVFPLGVDSNLGFGQYDPNYRDNPPVTLRANDTLIITQGGTPNQARTSYYQETSQSTIAHSSVLTVVLDSQFPSATDFRPGAIGDPNGRRFLSHDAIVWDRLPDWFDQSAAGGPQLAYVEALFAGFSGELASGWTGHLSQPYWSNPNYGEWIADAAGEALMVACSGNLTNAARQLLVKRICQWAIDFEGATRDGRTESGNGGQEMGHKAMVIFAGHMMGLDAFTDPDASMGSYPYWEKEGTAGAIYRDAGAVRKWWGLLSRWGYQVGGHESRNYEHLAPSGWAAAVSQSSWYENYYRPTHPGNVAQALAMAAINRTVEWGRTAWMEIVGHMLPKAPAYASELTAAGVSQRASWDQKSRSSRLDDVAGGWAASQWAANWLNAMRYRTDAQVFYATAPSVVAFDEIAVPMLFDSLLTAYASPITVEVMNASLDGTIDGFELWFGELVPDGGTDSSGGWAHHMYAKTPLQTFSSNLPNAYGHHSFSFQVPSPDSEAAKDKTWCLQIRYTAAGVPVVGVAASAPLAFYIPPENV